MIISNELLTELIQKIKEDNSYIIKNYSFDDRIILFKELLINENNNYDIEEDDLIKFILAILTSDEFDKLKNILASDEYEEIEYFKIFFESPDLIASNILSKEKNILGINFEILFYLPQEKAIEILKIVKDSLSDIINNKDILDDIVNIKNEDEFYLIIKKLDESDVELILDNYPNLIQIYKVLDKLSDDYKEKILDNIKEYERFTIINSIKDRNKKCALALKYLDDMNLENLIKGEKSETFRLELLYKYYDRISSNYSLEGLINTFDLEENIYNAIEFLFHKNIIISGYFNVFNKLNNEYLIKLIDLYSNVLKSYDLFSLIKRLDFDKKYEYILKFKNKLVYYDTDIIKILITDLRNNKIDEENFVNIIIEILKDRAYINKYDIMSVIYMVNDANKLKIIDSLGNNIYKHEIIDFMDSMSLSAKEKLDLIIKYDLSGVDYNKLISELSANLRLEYLEKTRSAIQYYSISTEDLSLILTDLDLQTQISILNMLFIHGDITFDVVLNSNLNFDLIDDIKLLELIDKFNEDRIKFFIASYIKNDMIKYQKYIELFIMDYSYLVDVAVESLKDEKIKFEFITRVIKYRNNLEYAIVLLDKVNLDSNFLENFINRDKDVSHVLIQAIMISKFDDKLKMKYFKQLNLRNDNRYLKLLIESLKFNDDSLDYNIFKEAIKDMFYKREFDLFEQIEIDNLKYYFDDVELYFLTQRKMFKESDKKILDSYIDVKQLDKNRIEYVVDVIKRINNSNCLEVIRLGEELKPILIEEENAFEKIKSLEKIFLRNNLPFGAKLYEVFEILHPDFEKFNGTIYSKTINDGNISMSNKYKILLDDMIRITFLSSPNQGLDYLDEMQKQIDLLRKVLYIKNKNIKYEQLDEDSKIIVNNILNIVNSWGLIFKVQKESNLSVVYDYLNNNVIEGIEDWIANIISSSIGIDFKRISDIRQYIINNTNNINERNKNYKDFTLKKGDLVKGISNYEIYLFGMLQNGINCKEFLGANAGGDSTSLDADFSMIRQEDENIDYTISRTTAACYGSVWIVIKNREGRFNTSGDPKDKRMELFKINGEFNDNYGIRSGVPVTEIDYIICNDWNERIGFAIACSGIYIPVVDKESKLLFSYDDFIKMKKNMQGLSYYGNDEYKISSTIYKGNSEILNYLEKDAEEISRKRNIVYNEIDSLINSLGYNVLHTMDDDFTNDNMELIDTGSTSRGNNKPNDADFDFMFRMNSDIYNDENNKLIFVKTIENRLKELGGIPNVGNNPPSRLRYNNVLFDGIDKPIEIDISFIQRTNKVDYTTDMCLIDRMNNIKKQYPELYNSVRLNVIIAKSILKKAGIYKRVEKCLGGVGTENWILQNGGSVIDAVNSFLNVANTCKSFTEFKSKYSIFDFGSNFYESSVTDGHDNFIYNLSEENYEKMKETLIEFKKGYDQALNNGFLDEYISNLIEFENLNLENNKRI